ncbi:DUF4426 domain-containing protein [Marinospirillum sp.]|uniref:DUF4426 domain-containing protein n=1 Tax=Marinospirillum sp. TaxID=2183934 RepID=UPI00384FB5BE
MNTLQKNRVPGVALTTMLAMALVALLAGCNGSEQTADSSDNQTNVDQSGGDEQPLGDVAEFDGFTLRANVSPTEYLSDAMAQQHGIEADPSLVMLNVVILEKRPEQRPVTVSGELSVFYESLTGRDTDIDMRSVKTNDGISYIGTLDTSEQRFFAFVIEAQPEGTDEPLQMNFEVQLP